MISIVQAVFMLLAGLLIMTMAQSEPGRFLDDLTGGAVTFVGLMVLAIGTTLLVAGINTCRGRNWARILVIVLQSLFILFGLASMSDADDGVGVLVVAIVISGAALVLAVLGKPRPNHASA